MAAVKKEHGDEPSSEATPADEKISVEEQKMTHRHAVLGQIPIVFEAIGEIKVLIGVGKQKIETIVSLVLKLLGEFDEWAFVGNAIQSFEMKITRIHNAAV
jgi:hypothetical protein